MPPLAGRGDRLIAVILDTLLFTVVVIPLTLFAGFSINDLLFYEIDGFGLDSIRPMLAGGTASLLVTGLQIFLLARDGQTVGKRLMGIRIASYASDQHPGFLRIVGLRMFLPAVITSIPCVGFLFSLLNILFIFGSEKRCLHDLIAGTKVIRGPYPTYAGQIDG